MKADREAEEKEKERKAKEDKEKEDKEKAEKEKAAAAPATPTETKDSWVSLESKDKPAESV